MKNNLYIGLMSGTSLDGVDAVLADFTDTAGQLRVQTLGHAHLPFPEHLSECLKALNWPSDNEIHKASLAANALAKIYAQAVSNVLQETGVSASQISAIGAHGQTVRHHPQQWDGIGYTVQLNQPALLAEFTGIDVVADFRSRDIAAAGQGAPLVPAFHQQIFARAGENIAVLNLGGIANVSILASDGRVLGFDTGPANTLLDGWIRQHQGLPWDEAGQWAASGSVIPALLNAMLQEPYFSRQGAKSTGLDLFNLTWLQTYLEPYRNEPAENIQATLAELTAASVVSALHATKMRFGQLAVCGGGARNVDLMHRLQCRLGDDVKVCSTAGWGVDPMHVEALAFAWLARQCIKGLPGNISSVTGAKGPRILGALYQA